MTDPNYKQAWPRTESPAETPSWFSPGSSRIVRAFVSIDEQEETPPPPDSIQDEPQVAEPMPTIDPLEEQRRMMEAELAQLREQTFQQAHDEGKAEGLKSYEERIVQLEALLRDLMRARDRRLAQMEQQLLELTVEVAHVVLEKEIESNPNYIIQMIRTASSLISKSDETEIRLNPNDVLLVKQQLEALSEELPQAGELRIVGDESISAGCVVDTATVRIDGSIDGRLRNVLRAIKRETA